MKDSQQQAKGAETVTAPADPVAAPSAKSSCNKAQPKLRILCLHGFRQNASQFRGRTAALRKRLRHIADLVYIDAPYLLPLWYKTPHQQNQELHLEANEEQQQCKDQQPQQQRGEQPQHEGQDMQERPNSLKDRNANNSTTFCHQKATAALAMAPPAGVPKGPNTAGWRGSGNTTGAGLTQQQQEQPWGAANMHQLPQGFTALGHAAPAPMPLPAPKRAWLVSPLLMDLQADLQRLFLLAPSISNDEVMPEDAAGISRLQAPAAAGISRLQAPAAAGISRLQAPAAAGISRLQAPAAAGISRLQAPAAAGISRLQAPAAAGSSDVAAATAAKESAAASCHAARCRPAAAHQTGVALSNSSSLPGQPAALPVAAAASAAFAAAASGPAPVLLDDQQFLGQTCGWEASWEVLQTAIKELGPFDGLLGFSQGASVAAVIAALQQQEQQPRPPQQAEPQQRQLHEDDLLETWCNHEGQYVDGACSQGMASGAVRWSKVASTGLEESGPNIDMTLGEVPLGECPDLGFRFVVVCSGFVSPCAAHQQLMQKLAPLQIPSLHICGSSEGGDRQITHARSQELASLFDDECKQLLIHPSGHHIPCSKDVTSEIVRFLGKFIN